MTYTKTTWVNDTTPAIDETNLNKMETGIDEAHDAIDTHLGSTSNPHSVTKSQVSLANVTDDAQLKRAAADINSFTEKTTPVNADIVIIEDSAASYAKKKVQVGNLPGGGGGEANTASNVGTAGVGVFKQKTGADLEFKKINAGSSNITITDDTANSEVDVDVIPCISLDYDALVTTDFTSWETYVTGTGEVLTGPHHLRASSASDIGSTANCHCEIFNTVDATGLPHAYRYFDIDVDIGWVIGMEDDCATSETDLIYSPNTSGLTTCGFGFRIDNLAAKGVVHDGTSLYVIDLATTMIVGSLFRLSIVFTAGVKIEWYINGVLKGESANIPTGTETVGSGYISIYVTNGDATSTQAVNVFRTVYRQKTWS